MGMFSYEQEIMDKVTYSFITEKSLQYLTGQSQSSAEFLKRILELLEAAVAFCDGSAGNRIAYISGMDAFILFSQAIQPEGSIKDFGVILTDYGKKIEGLLAGDESNKQKIIDLLVSLRQIIEQQIQLTYDKKTRWRL